MRFICDSVGVRGSKILARDFIILFMTPSQVSVDERVQPLGSSRCDLRRSQDEEDEEDELRMLAILKREQEEGDGDMGGLGLSASQPVDQGQHYQTEMNPLLHSNPREWMDVLSPPIVHPNQQMADGKGDHGKVSPRGRVYVLTTVLIILIWYFSINWSKLQEAAKWSHEVSDFVTDCDNPGLFKSHFGCCPYKHCPVNHFPFHLHSGAANMVAAKICFNNTIIMGGINNNAGQGLNIVLANGETGAILRNKYFNLESKGPKELLAYLKTLKPGIIVLLASYIDPTPKLTDEIRNIFTALGSTMVKSLKPRDSWVFAGAYGRKEASPFEKLIRYDMRSNAYEDWPEMAEVIGCFPRISETE
ncbi:FAM3D-like isoform X1 [Labeo rohita]|uniref:FAM3D-like isoform X1 n=1 Tax=Labeo rohita TaxID=84645 RepID=A0A498P080_LABRO|nr:FAM3D-like isoform X1 [Labeo rohita]